MIVLKHVTLDFAFEFWRRAVFVGAFTVPHVRHGVAVCGVLYESRQNAHRLLVVRVRDVGHAAQRLAAVKQHVVHLCGVMHSIKQFGFTSERSRVLEMLFCRTPHPFFFLKHFVLFLSQSYDPPRTFCVCVCLPNQVLHRQGKVRFGCGRGSLCSLPLLAVLGLKHVFDPCR